MTIINFSLAKELHLASGANLVGGPGNSWAQQWKYRVLHHTVSFDPFVMSDDGCFRHADVS
jgi:hypothetical protein